ncbi:prepilin peptidase [Hyphococcus formosus]|uniref:prepilin peptidase n=1 Tax=Hyphococcus formosus TaxID=3143534 RepID=UPI00398A98F4
MIPQWVLLTTIFILGLLAGSFLNVVIYRGPHMWGLIDGPERGNLAFPRSSCPECGEAIKPVHLIPIIGFLLLRGKCAACGTNIPIRYPLIEFAGALCAIGSVVLFGFTVTAGLAAIFLLFLVTLAAIDFETSYLPDALTLPLVALGIITNAVDLFVPFLDAVIGAVAGYAVFRLIDIVFTKLRGIEGLGQGDAKLLAAIGAWLGWAALAPTVFVAAMLGLVSVGIIRLKGHPVTSDMAIAFGPALAAAAIIMMIGRGLISL